MSSKKCPQCGMVNFATDVVCRRCEQGLSAPRPSQSSNLLSCPDCDASVSRYAESCPRCGRFYQVLRPQPVTEERGRGWWAVTIGWGIIMSGVIMCLLTFIFWAFIFTLAGIAGASR